MGIERMIARGPACLIGAALTVLLLFPLSALAEKRIALVIGNGSYKEAPLDSPPRDADLIAGVLRNLNFEVTRKKNVNQKTMKRLIRDFGKRLKEASDAVGFFGRRRSTLFRATQVRTGRVTINATTVRACSRPRGHPIDAA